jgi:hypothetical protein
MDSMTTVMVFMAGLALGSDGTERVSAETEQRLAISGNWEGVLKSWTGGKLKTWKLELGPDWMKVARKLTCRWIDEGQGKCRVILDGEHDRYGIYKREAGQLVICYAYSGDRPTSFHANPRQPLLILKPVHPPGK